MLAFPVSELVFDVFPFSSEQLAAVGEPDPCLQVAGQVWDVSHLATQGSGVFRIS